MAKEVSNDNDALFEREIGRLRFRAPFLLASLIEKDPRAMVEAGWRFVTGKRVTRDFNVAERIIRSGKSSSDTTLSLLYSVSRLDPLPIDEPPPSQHIVRSLLLSAQAGSVYATRQLAATVFRAQTLASFRPQVLDCMRICAQKRDPVCNYELGVFHHGLGSQKDLALAAEYYSAAASRGDIDAAFNLGLLWATQSNVHIPASVGLKMLRYAANRGEPKASYELGYLNAIGHSAFADKTQDDRNATAARWYRRSAVAGDVMGQAAFAECARKGCGVAPNMKQAAEFFAWAAIQGDHSSLKKLLRCRTGLPKSFSVNTIKKAIDDKTVLWWLLADNNGPRGKQPAPQ